MADETKSEPTGDVRVSQDALDAGLAAAFGSDDALIISGTGHSVLKSIGRQLPTVPHIVLRDRSDDAEPIVRPHSSEVPPGDSRYQLLGEIARGGMGSIIKGRDTDLGRDLAIKVLLDAHKDKPEVIQRFIEEAQIGGQLQHPGIAPIYELGQFADRRPFFSMKLVKGQTLSTLLTDGENPADERGKFLGIFEQICQTMAYAHSRGVIHRDLKPANIMVGAFGEVYVVDWGLAKVLSAGGIADEKKARTKQTDVSVIRTLRSGDSDTPGTHGSDTRMGSVMGTPAYMSPEQALGEIDHLDERADVFSLGAILCEILTGRPPYVSEDGTDSYRLAARGKLDSCFARLDACGVDAELIELAKHCLQVEPGDRPRHAGVLAQRFSDYLESVDRRLRETEIERAAQAARVVEERKRRRITMALAACLLLMVTVAAGAWVVIQNQHAERLRVATAEVNEALTEARLHHGLANNAELRVQVRELEKALFMAEQASELAQQNQVDQSLQQEAARFRFDLQNSVSTLQQEAARTAADSQFKTQLENIRMRQADGWWFPRQSPELSSNRLSGTSRYEAAFREAGLDLVALSAEEAAERVRNSAIRETIIAALDDLVHSPLNVLQTEFDSAVLQGQWRTAAEFGRKLIARQPVAPLVWLRVAPIIVLAKDEAGYREFCSRMAAQFTENNGDDLAGEKTCKACLLWPGAIEFERLPTSLLEESLEDAPDSILPWLWGTKALVALRSGDAESALECIENSQEYEPLEVAVALNLAVRALANQRLDRLEDAHRDVQQAAQKVDQLLQEEFTKSTHHDVLIAMILLREAQDVINNKPRSQFFAKSEAPDVVYDSGFQKVATVSSLTLRAKAIKVANLADSSPWRRELRSALHGVDVARLKELATSEELPVESPKLIVWLGSALRDAEELDLALATLQRGQVEFPDDFWLNYELGVALQAAERDMEGIAYIRAAVAVRPHSFGAVWHLAQRLRNAGQLEESIPVFRRLLSGSIEANAFELNEVAWSLLTPIEEELWCDAELVLKLAETACTEEEAASGDRLWMYLDTLAIAHWKTGDVAAALETQQRAMALMPESTSNKNRNDILKRLSMYEESLAEGAQRPDSDAEHVD